MNSPRQTPSAKTWSNLPLEILTAIGKLLDSQIDVFFFRSVYKNWRSSLNPSSKPSLLCPFLPCTISQPSLPFNDNTNEPLLVLVARTVLLVKPLDSPDFISYCPDFIDFDIDLTSPWIITVEEMVPGKLRIQYPLSKNRVNNLPSNFPKHLNLLEFRVQELTKSYCLKHVSDCKDVVGVHRVVLCSAYTIMVLYGEGILVGVRLKKGKWFYVRDSLFNSFCDVINVKGLIYGADYYGKLCIIDHLTTKVIKVINVNNLEYSLGKPTNLVESNREHYLVSPYCSRCPSKVSVSIYKLDKLKSEWVTVNWKLEALFYSVDGCFFVENFGRGYVFYSEECVSSFIDGCILKVSSISKGIRSVDLQIGYVDKNKSDYDKKIDWHWIADALWPPPTWFWADSCSSSGEDEESEELDFSAKEVQYPIFTNPSPSGVAFNTKQGLITKNNGISMHSVTMEDSNALRVQNLNTCVSTTIFEGVIVKSNLVPTLQSIWSNHGNVLKQCTMRNGDLIARALESLATTVLILQSTSGRSLNETQADYLSSAVSDLQQMHINVDWLVPFVERALAVTKSKSLIDSLKKFSKAKSFAQEMKLKVLDELAKLDEVEEDMKFVFEKVPNLEDVDLDQILGEGLF